LIILKYLLFYEILLGTWSKATIPVLASILILGLIPFNGASAVTEDTKLTASDAAAGDQFGFSVSISGDTAIVGANFDDDAGTNSGSAYVFEFSASTGPPSTPGGGSGNSDPPADPGTPSTTPGQGDPPANPGPP